MRKLALFAAVAFLAIVPAAKATITNPTTTVTDTATGSNLTWNYGFLIPANTDGSPAITLMQIDTSGVKTAITSNFSVSGVGNPSGGTVTYPVTGSPLPAGYQLIITRALPYIQTTAFPNNSFYPKSVESTADNIVMQIQQLDNEINNIQAAAVPQINCAGSG